MVSKNTLLAKVIEYEMSRARWIRDYGAVALKCETSGHGEGDALHWGKVTHKVSAKCHICNNIFYSAKNCCTGWAMATKGYFDAPCPISCGMCGERGMVHEVVKLEEL